MLENSLRMETTPCNSVDSVCQPITLAGEFIVVIGRMGEEHDKREHVEKSGNAVFPRKGCKKFTGIIPAPRLGCRASLTGHVYLVLLLEDGNIILGKSPDVQGRALITLRVADLDVCVTGVDFEDSSARMRGTTSRMMKISIMVPSGEWKQYHNSGTRSADRVETG